MSNTGSNKDPLNVEAARTVVVGDFTYVNNAGRTPSSGSAPPVPSLFMGRDDEMRELRARLGPGDLGGRTSATQVLTAVRGWPGIGKTTMAAALAHDDEIIMRFPDGVLWTSLGSNPSVLSELASWGRALGTDELLRAHSIEEASAQLTALLRTKRVFLIIDDVWEPEHARPFMVGGRHSATLVTTRITSTAQAIAPPEQIFLLGALSREKALGLLRLLAPSVVAQYASECEELIAELEALPLALQVAGRMLNAEANRGFSVVDLLEELKDGTRVLQGQAPADRIGLAAETSIPVAVLFQKSTERLDAFTRDCFAYLGPFAPKPAMFDLAAMKFVWKVDESQAKSVVGTLVDRGLLEYVPEIGRYQLHALLVAHAKALLAAD
jgi:hypothetical protein